MIRFQPIYQSRVWGGRELENKFGRELPEPETPFGESWELSAREEADSVVISKGNWERKTLTQLWNDNASREAIFGTNAPKTERFPLLCKILDAREKLSVQVHPPADIAPRLGGEPKSEIWFIADADPGAVIYVGLKSGVSSADFKKALEEGTVNECIHQIPVRPGQHIYIPSGRIHAIGAGVVIYEIQQNSDTTYRVFDWNRVGLNGEPRDLHIDHSLQCIDFSDVEPEMDTAGGPQLCESDDFRIEKHTVKTANDFANAVQNRFAIITVINGEFEGTGKGDFFILTPNCEMPDGKGEFLLTTWP